MLKRIMAFICMFVLLLTCISASPLKSYASADINLIINNVKVDTDVAPVIINDRTMVPARVLFEYFKAEVTWYDSLKQVVIKTGDKNIIFTIGSNQAAINGNKYTLDSAPVIVDSRTLIPIRFVSEKLGYSVDWNASSRTVYIYGGKTGNTVKDESKDNANNNVSAGGNTADNKENTNSSYEDTQQKEEVKIPYDAQISSVTVSEAKNGLEVNIKISNKVKPQIKTLKNPQRLIFDFENVNQICNDGKLKPSSGYGVNEIRWAKHEAYARLVIESDKAIKYSANFSSSGNYVIKIEKPSSSVVTDKVQNNVTKPSDDTPTVVIDAGHGGRDSGAVGRDEDGEIVVYEKKANLSIAKKVRDVLEKNGINVIMTRTTDVALGDTTMDDLLKRCEIANESDACLFVSVHNNAFTDPSSNGTCVLYAGLDSGEDYGITGKELAQNILTPLVKATGLKNRGLVDSPNIVVLKRTTMPAALVECAFVTNENDRKILLDDDKLDDIAGAIAEGIIKSLKQMNLVK